MSLISKICRSSVLPLALGVFAGGCSTAENNLVYCSEGSPESFNPQRMLSGTARNATAETIYNRLVEFKSGTTKVAPALAESWNISPDQKVYTFNLRKGVKFHTTSYFKPTRDFNADDVIFSVERQLKEQHPYHNVGGGTYQYFQGMGMDKLISSVRKVDAYTVEFTLDHPEAPFLADLAMPFMSVLSAEYGEKLTAAGKQEDMDNEPIGTGPYAFKRYVRDSTIRYVAHDGYWEGKSAVKDLVFAITPDASVRYQKLRKGECHVAIYPAPADLEAIKQNQELVLAEQQGMNIGYLAMNVEKAPFSNVLVRRAVAHALNKQSYVDAVFMGNAKVATNPYPPTMWSYNNQVRTYEYSPEKAKGLLKEAGLVDGFATTMWTLPVTRPYNPNGRKMGEMMQHDLAKVGIRVELLTYEWGTYLDKVKRGEHDMVQLGWSGDNGDPDNFLYTLLSCDSVTRGSNNSRYCQPEFNSLISQARVSVDGQAREQLYQKALMKLSEDEPIIPIAHANVYRAMSKNVTGYVMDPLDTDSFHNLAIARR